MALHAPTMTLQPCSGGVFDSAELMLLLCAAGTIMVWFLLLGLTLGSVLAYALTPLTRLVECTNCTSTAAVFQCSHDNGTFG